MGSDGIRTHNHLVRKRTLNHLAKLAKLVAGMTRNSLLESGAYLKFKWQQRNSNPEPLSS